jgi:hypothetical protein
VPIGGMSDTDPNEAYEMELVDYPRGWLAIRCNGVPVWYAPTSEAAERYATDPDHRHGLRTKKKAYAR